MNGDIVNHKGQQCHIKPILCQEGYCNNCAIQSHAQEKQLEHLKSMRETYRHNAYQLIVAEQIGTGTLRHIHKKKSFIKRLLRR